MEDKNIKKLDYEPLGCIRPAKGVSTGLYIFAGVLIIAGIIVNFAVLSSALIFGVFVFFALLSALCGLAFAKNILYWGEEKFTVMQLFSKAKTISYSDIDKVYSVTEGMGMAVTVMIRLKSGKEYSVPSPGGSGKEFLEHLLPKLGIASIPNYRKS